MPRLTELPIVSDDLPPDACTRPLVRESVGGSEVTEAVKKVMFEGGSLPELEGPLSVENYVGRMAAVYQMEELQMQVDIRSYDIQDAMLTSSREKFLELHVLGLAERRPSVVMGDRVYVTPADGVEGARTRQQSAQTRGPNCEFEAYVHAVRPDVERIYIKSPRLNTHTPYHVRFSVNRESIAHAQHALQLCLQDPDFPPLAPLILPFELPSVLEETEPVGFERKDGQLNEEQLEAVSQILLRTQLRREEESEEPLPPYIIFGPPGTGKTKTLVEAIFQVLRADPDASILVCAPSNAAADNLLERLQEMRQDELIRVNVFHRPKEGPGALSLNLEKFARYDCKNGAYVVPSAEHLRHAHVIITTCSSSALLWRQGLGRGEFSHIFIDEAGHATEPECFIPIGCFAAADTVIVLAGDHQQLGPTVRSPLARERGFGISYLERLYRLPMYDAEAGQTFVGFHAPVITKLLRTYRSHPAISMLSSRMFYQDDLVSGEGTPTDSLCQWPHLPTRGFPIIFEGVQGLDEREGSSPSWFNATEARKVKGYIENLRMSWSPFIDMKTVGVITPYRKQVEKLKKLLDAHGYGMVKVGTVEEFQGQEMRVIIISTVRSSPEHIKYDRKHNLGFLGHPKRFNVAVTRAKELLIIVGNPHILSQDKYWGAMLQYCVDEGGYTGCPLPNRADGPEASLRVYVSIGDEIATGREESAKDGGENTLRVSAVALHEEPAWPSPE